MKHSKVACAVAIALDVSVGSHACSPDLLQHTGVQTLTIPRDKQRAARALICLACGHDVRPMLVLVAFGSSCCTTT